MKTKNQTGLKIFKPKINLNHNMYNRILPIILKWKNDTYHQALHDEL